MTDEARARELLDEIDSWPAPRWNDDESELEHDSQTVDAVLAFAAAVRAETVGRCVGAVERLITAETTGGGTYTLHDALDEIRSLAPDAGGAK